jgi:CelD/BcsL family acetyltransferase involved in cellulose biosynthesis
MDELPMIVPGTAAAVEWPATRRAVGARTVQTPAELELFASDWNAIRGSFPTPIQHFVWVRAAARAFGDDALRVVLLRINDRASAIAPLVARRNGAVARLELIGTHELHEPMDFLYSDSQSADELAAEICRNRLPLRLERIPAHSAVLPALEKAIRGRGFMITRAEAGCPFIALDDGWTEPMQKFTPRRRSDLRRMQRLADSLGSVQYEVTTPGAEQVGPLLKEAFRVEAASWKGRTGTALADDMDARHFFTLYATDAAAQGMLRICFLRIDGRAVAMQLAAECHHRFWLLKIGYDEQYARCSPGSLLMLHTLAYAARRGLKSYELLGTDEPWTQAWSTTVRPCVSIRTYPANPRGLVALSADALEAVWMKAKTKLGRA